MKTNMKRLGRHAVSAALVSLFGAAHANAINFIWSGGVGDGNWNTNANWFNMNTGKTAATYPGNSTNLAANAVIDDATFDNTSGYFSGPATLPATIAIPSSGIELATISFGDTETNGVYTLASNVSIGSAGTQITLNGSSGGLVRLGSGTDGIIGGTKTGLSYNATSGVQTIVSNLLSNATQTWNINGTGEILATGTIGNAAGQLINKSGSGELEIAANNSATLLGGFTAQGGTTLIDNALSLGSGSTSIQLASTTSTNGTSLLTNSGVTFGRNIVTVANTKSVVETLGGAAGSSVWTGSIALNYPVSLTSSASGTTAFNGVISDGTGGTDDASKAFNFSSSLVTKTGTGTVVLGASNTYSGGTNVSGGVLTGAVPGAFGSGNLTVYPTGGTNTAADAVVVNTTSSIAPAAVVTINTNSNTATGTVNFLGSNETIGSLAGNGSAVLANPNGTTLTVGSAGSSTFSGTISDIGGLGKVIKTGTSTLTLSGSNTYGGGTNISSGTLLVSNVAGSATGSGPVVVAVSASLGGTGLIAGAVTVNGTAFTGLTNNTSGKTASVMTFGAGSVFGGSLLEDIVSTTSSDELVFTGSSGVTVGGSIDITNPNNVALAAGQSWQLINYGANPVTGSFGTVVLPTLPSGLVWSQSLATSGTLSIISTGSTGAANLTWTNALGNGLWDTTSANWNCSAGVVAYSDNSNGATGDNVNFTSGGTITIGTTVHPTSVTFSSPGALTVASAGNSSSGIAGSTALTITGGETLTLSANDTYSGGTNISSGTLVLASSTALPSASALTISAGATLQLAPHTTGVAVGAAGIITPIVGSLSNSGLIDITNNSLIVRGAAARASVVTQVASSFNGGGNGGGWNATSGIISSTAAADTAHLTTIGAFVNDNGSGSPILTSLDGVPTVDGDVLIKYTYYGDANLDGAVDGSDYTLIDHGFANHLTGWNNGDFNYDGIVDGSDYTLIDNAFNSQGASLGSSPASLIAGTAAEIGGTSTASVPEPTDLLGVLAASALLGVGRRRRFR